VPQFNAGGLERWDPALFPYDERARNGICRFAPNCGGVEYGDPPRKARPDHPGCPDHPAEFAERIGMNEADARTTSGTPAEERYMALCRPRALRRFGARDVRITETGETGRV